MAVRNEGICLVGPLKRERYVVLPIRFGKLGGKFLVTTDLGGWALLTA